MLQTDWEGGYDPLTMHFSEDYPSKPPKCKFPQGLFHPNVFPSGTVCLSILNEDSVSSLASIVVGSLISDYCLLHNAILISLCSFGCKGVAPSNHSEANLRGIQDLLDQPNPADPAQTEGYHLFIQVFKCFCWKLTALYAVVYLTSYLLLSLIVPLLINCIWSYCLHLFYLHLVRRLIMWPLMMFLQVFSLYAML